MPASIQPFPLPRKLPKPLKDVLEWWRKLRRAENTIPFADDVNPSELSRLTSNLLLVDVFAKPERFRFNSPSESLIGQLHADMAGKFADELELHSPLDFFLSQASATVEAKAPTCYAGNAGGSAAHRARSYSRMLLPTWGDGRVQLLICVID
jgi:hypothetical protein